MEQDDDVMLALCGWAQDEEEEARRLRASDSYGSLMSSSKSSSFLPSRANVSATPIKTHVAPVRTKLAMAAVSIGSSCEAPPTAKRSKYLISALRVKLESDIEHRRGRRARTEPSVSERQKQQLRKSPSSRVIDSNWPALYRLDPPSDEVSLSSGHSNPLEAAVALDVVVPTCKIVELIPDSDSDASPANRSDTLPALHGSHSASDSIGVSSSSRAQNKVRQHPPWICTDEANSPEQLNHYAWELTPHKKGLTRHHPLTRGASKHQQSQTLRPMKQRSRALVRDLLADSVAKELEELNRNMERKLCLKNHVDTGAQRGDVNLWEYQHEQSSSIMYENSMGIVKALTQFSKHHG